MKNNTKSEYWIKMAEEDLKDASIDLENSRFPSSVFHSQRCTEKADLFFKNAEEVMKLGRDFLKRFE